MLEDALVADVIPEVLAAVSRQLPVEPDGWAPTVQGAVGHVRGLRGRDGSRYVLKLYPLHATTRAATEADALHRLRGLAGVDVPDVLLTGDVEGPFPYAVLSRLPGVRWADRRAELTPSQSRALIAAVGRLLRRLHQLPGARFGALLPDGRSWPTAWQRVDARCDELIRRDLGAGGSADLSVRVRRFVDRHRSALASCQGPVLCHNDFIDSNILVAAAGDPAICGVVDLERASWDDPVCDLAQTRLHVRYHDAAGADVLTGAYGIETDVERCRLDVYEVLHALEERTWISCDRPAGWQRSVAALETYLADRT